MKKILSIFLVTVLSLSMVACSSENVKDVVLEDNGVVTEEVNHTILLQPIDNYVGIYEFEDGKKVEIKSDSTFNINYNLENADVVSQSEGESSDITINSTTNVGEGTSETNTPDNIIVESETSGESSEITISEPTEAESTTTIVEKEELEVEIPEGTKITRIPNGSGTVTVEYYDSSYYIATFYYDNGNLITATITATEIIFPAETELFTAVKK